MIAQGLFVVFPNFAVSVYQGGNEQGRNQGDQCSGKRRPAQLVTLFALIQCIIGTADQRRENTQAFRSEETAAFQRRRGHNVGCQRLKLSFCPRTVRDIPDQQRRKSCLLISVRQYSQNMIAVMVLEKIGNLTQDPLGFFSFRGADDNQKFRTVQSLPNILGKTARDGQFVLVAKDIAQLFDAVISQFTRDDIMLDPSVKFDSDTLFQRKMPITDKSFVSPYSVRHNHFLTDPDSTSQWR